MYLYLSLKSLKSLTLGIKPTPSDPNLQPPGPSLSIQRGATAEAVKHGGVRPGWSCWSTVLF